ncbi:MAG: insulinase family protein [Treponema sp.]|nr:insulinase family protein [Treponema sp.]
MRLNTIKNFIKKNILASFLAFACISAGGIFTSCGSTKAVDTSTFGSPEDFTRRLLSNGVPVIFKQNRGSKIIVLRLIFEGGSSTIDKSMGGIEAMTLDLALHGSESYKYADIQKLEYEKSFSLSSSSGRDYSTAGFVCIQRDLAEVINIFTDCIMNPAFLESDFNKKMQETSSEIAAKKADPSGTLGNAIAKVAFDNHPYSTTTSVTEESYPNISLTMIKGIHQSLLNALRLKIVVTGNFSHDMIESLVSELDGTIGQIPRKAYSAPKIPKIPVSTNTVRIANEQAGDTGYIAGLFECPSRSDSNYIPFAIASMYIDDLFFSQVREKAGAVYSINSGIIGGKELLGVISIYKASEKKNLKKLVCEAIDSFSEEEITKKLEQYKNKYITSIFSSAQTASGLTGSVISSLEYFGSESAYLGRADQVAAVEAKQVVSAYKKYFEPISKQNAAQWIIVDGEENLEEYEF